MAEPKPDPKLIPIKRTPRVKAAPAGVHEWRFATPEDGRPDAVAICWHCDRDEREAHLPCK